MVTFVIKSHFLSIWNNITITQYNSINNGAIQIVCGLHKEFLLSHSPISHSASFTLSLFLCYSLKLTNCGMRGKNIFCMYDCLVIPCYIKGCTKLHYRHNRIFRHTCMCKKSILIKQCNYNIFLQVSNSYLRYTDTLLDVLFLLLALFKITRVLWEQTRKDWLMARSLVVSDFHSEAKDSRFESCH